MKDNNEMQTQIDIPDGLSEQEKQKLLVNGFNSMYVRMYLDLVSRPDAPIKEKNLYLHFLNSIGVKKGEPLDQTQALLFQKWVMQQTNGSTQPQTDSRSINKGISSKIQSILAKLKELLHI